MAIEPIEMVSLFSDNIWFANDTIWPRLFSGNSNPHIAELEHPLIWSSPRFGDWSLFLTSLFTSGTFKTIFSGAPVEWVLTRILFYWGIAWGLRIAFNFYVELDLELLGAGGSSFGLGIKIGFFASISCLTPSRSFRLLYGILDIGFFSMKSSSAMQYALPQSSKTAWLYGGLYPASLYS